MSFIITVFFIALFFILAIIVISLFSKKGKQSKGFGSWHHDFDSSDSSDYSGDSGGDSGGGGGDKYKDRKSLVCAL
ncbi:MAG: hypothetical protein ACE3JN_16900 [Ectobacillus sp.]